MRIALEIQHGVDDVLQHARAGQRALFRHVADHDDGDAGLLGDARQLRRAFAHLRHRAGRRTEGVGIHGLDRIDDGDFRLVLGQRAEDFFQLDFGLQLQVARIDRQPLGAQGDLGAGFLAADIQHFFQPRQIGQRLQQQGRLADARVAADQHHAAGHQAAAQHAVEFLDAGAEARHVDRLDVGQRHHRRALRQALMRGRKAIAGRLDDGFDQRIPLAAGRALASPFVADAAAFGAGVVGFWFSHGMKIALNNSGGAIAGAREWRSVLIFYVRNKEYIDNIAF